MKLKTVLILGIMFNFLRAHSQGFGIPSRHWGIGFGGGSEIFSGILFELSSVRWSWGSGVRYQNGVINGVSLSFRHGANKIRGFGLGIVSTSARKMSGLHISGVFTTAEKSYGVQLSGLVISVDTDLYGLSIAPVIQIGATKYQANSKGVSIALYNNYVGWASTFSGVSIGLYNMVKGTTVYEDDEAISSGVSIGLCNSVKNGKQRGLMIGLYNHAHKMKGVQIGLLNRIAENPAWLRTLPFLNLRFKKTHKSSSVSQKQVNP